MIRTRNRRQRGFSLIELMIVVAIISVLAVIAVPVYTTYMLHGRRAEAYALLEQDQAMLERCYAQDFTYTAAACPAPAKTSAQGYYTLAPATAITAASYVLTVVPHGSQARDKACAAFSLDSANVRSAKNSSGVDNTAACWAR